MQLSESTDCNQPEEDGNVSTLSELCILCVELSLQHHRAPCEPQRELQHTDQLFILSVKLMGLIENSNMNVQQRLNWVRDGPGFVCSHVTENQC